jgi:hypothetical protein
VFDALARTAATKLSALIAEARATAPTGAYEALGPDFSAEEGRLARFCEDIAFCARALATEANARIEKANAALSAYAAAGLDADRAKALDEAAKALFGGDFFIVPGVHLSRIPRDDETAATQEGDWSAALTGAGALFNHLVNDLKRIDPVDEWFAAAARVRTPLKHLERAAILSEGLGGDAVRLDAFQLPYIAGDAWLGAEFPETQDLNNDRLLYTAHLSVAWTPARPVFGLLIDEWVETLPVAAEMTGLAFHFDRPNAEAPQAMLLVTPPAITGAWKWEDIVDAVNETLDLAKARAVEPAFIDETPYARLLPTLLFSMARTEITIVADLALNNHAIRLKALEEAL